MQYKIQTSKFSRKGISAEGCKGCLKRQLNTFDYLADLPEGCNKEDFVEVQFKHTRKGYYLNSEHLPLKKGDMVAVEASPGHDIGVVTLTGKLVQKQMEKVRYRHPKGYPQRIYRLASETDLERYNEVKALEQSVMIHSREIAKNLGLDMKIGDVEYQGDGQKAIFYYISDGRVDFRQLIKDLARVFRIRVEMRQIGARQEAGRIGGIGPCGQNLCCSAWMTNFVSVGTQAARLQDISMNPQKLAGQCGKLKCCINFEVDTYCEARQKLPPRDVRLETQAGAYKQYKSDILSGEVSYVLQNKRKNEPLEPITISSERAFEIIDENKEGNVPFSLVHDDEGGYNRMRREQSSDILATSSLTRFDDEKEKPRRKKRRARNRRQPHSEERKAENRRGRERKDNQQKRRRPRRNTKSNRGRGNTTARKGSNE